MGAGVSHLRRFVRGLAGKLLPVGFFQQQMAARSRRYQLKLLQEKGIIERAKRYIEMHGTVVQAGPFAGLVYPLDVALDRVSTPKLLGSYEEELHPILQLATGREYECVIDIGSAEGYYSSGLARLLRVPVYAYEPEPKEKAHSSLMAKINGVQDLVRMEDLFTIEDIRRFAEKRAFVICDCEGFEEVLFRPEIVSLTRNWDLLIELHGSAEKTLPALDWPQEVSLIEYAGRTGLQDEYRGDQGQTVLWCDSQRTAPHA